MTKAPPIPPEQRAFEGEKPDVQAPRHEKSRGADAGNADLNLEEQGRYGDIKQNTTHQGYQQDR